MKLDQFKNLCHRQWMREPQDMMRGDVTALHLTNESLSEFSADVLTASSDEPWLRPLALLIPADSADRIVCGATVGEVLNPVTRSAVKVTGGAESDAAQVSYGSWREPETVFC